MPDISVMPGGPDPQLIEVDIFRMIISVPEFREKPDAPAEIVQVEAHDEAHDKAHEAQVTATGARP